MPWADYETWQRKSLRLMWDSLADDGAIFWNHKPRSVGGRLWKPDSLIEAPLVLRQEIVWARAGATSFNAACYAPSSERLYLITKDGWRLDSRGASSVGDVWYIPQERSAHPAPFPLELPARILRTVNLRSLSTRIAGRGRLCVLLLTLGYVASELTVPNGTVGWQPNESPSGACSRRERPDMLLRSSPWNSQRCSLPTRTATRLRPSSG